MTRKAWLLVVNAIMDAACSIRDSQIDIAFINTQSMILLALVECAKKLNGHARLCAKVLQPLCYMLCPLAFSRWGILTWEKPLIALLVSPDCFYRLTLSKPAESEKLAFGLHLHIARTRDPGMMEWAVHICQEFFLWLQDIAILQSGKTLVCKPSALDTDEH